MSVFGFEMKSPETQTRKPWKYFAAAIAIFLVVAIAFANYLKPPADFEGNGTTEVTVTIVAGDTLRKMGVRLYDAGVVASVDAWVAATASESRSSSIGPGDYNLRKEMGARQALELILDPSSRAVFKLVVKEGMRVVEIVKAASKVSGIAEDEFIEVLKKPDSFGLPKIAKGKPEGFLFPATYEINKNATATSILQAMTDRWRTASDELELTRRAAASGHTVLEILTIASILEVEAGVSDYAKVARVIENRLDKPMRLQLDSTVNYALGISELQLSADQMNVESAYNTYKVDGLTPGPIGNPGAAAIEAALEPAEGNWLYFVTVDPDTKLTKFAVTYEEFLVLKREFQANVA
ncbi:MAG: endolytic transglycosylase MltG [Actinomycetota bacterium]|jgi:UPF0755 protein